MSTKIKKILIANRGEISCRIIKTAHKLGIETVAVYSTADRSSLHVKLANQAVEIGPAEALASYLNINKIVKACLELKVEAVHPGYGFLSENPLFAEALEKAGLIFIGPQAKSIRAYGDKISAKKIASLAGVPILKTIEVKQTDNFPANLSEITFPLIIKAAAGGGGRGMRIVRRPEELQTNIEAASAEAAKFFADGTLFIEPFIEEARHIEIQILADKHGEIAAISDRDCSLQRKRQKIIEEAPAPFISGNIRKQIYAAAEKLLAFSGYQSAGTVEFLLTPSEKFYFLEVNTRLQVEHPVSEEVTGLDLVAAQIKIASGESLKSALENSRAPIKPSAHAIELRLCAEAPLVEFAPSAGLLTKFKLPKNVRNDFGFTTGDLITHYYDSLIAKIIVSGENRQQAIAKARRAISELEIAGIENNSSLLQHLLSLENFATGKYSIHTVDRLNIKELYLQDAALIAAGFIFFKILSRSEIAYRLIGSELSLLKESEFLIDQVLKAKINFSNHPKITVHLNDQTTLNLDIEKLEVSRKNRLISFTLNKIDYTIGFILSGDLYYSYGSLGSHTIKPISHFKINRADKNKQTDHLQSDQIASNLPGKVIKIHKQVGSPISAGEIIITIESMKMEHGIKTPRQAVLQELLVQVGQNIAAGEPLAIISI
ncbi:MAG TPA: biotin carboxylase N-terminal domain-containing protein [Oligoflexia bacterium]|nr:biotin carboxylase N-terminal domain-containing protein [Oligoflexia bacterium]HMP27156.1 biotin carboxylase N-terminal domain-containing protein [Oligoflexia bacterium]